MLQYFLCLYLWSGSIYFSTETMQEKGKQMSHMLFWRCDLFQSTRILSSNIHSYTAFKPHLKLRVFQKRRDMNNAFVRCGLLCPLSSKELHRQFKLWRGGGRSVSNAVVFEKQSSKSGSCTYLKGIKFYKGPQFLSTHPSHPKIWE